MLYVDDFSQKVTAIENKNLLFVRDRVLFIYFSITFVDKIWIIHLSEILVHLNHLYAILLLLEDRFRLREINQALISLLPFCFIDDPVNCILLLLSISLNEVDRIGAQYRSY